MVKPATLQITEQQWQQVAEILQHYLTDYPVLAFGSRVNGTPKPYSDLDLEQPLPLSLLAEVTEAFSESDLPWKVDLVDWATTSERFRQVIQQQKLVVN